MNDNSLKNNQILLCGRTGSGKTTWIINYMTKNKNLYDLVYVFTSTPQEYIKLTNKKNIFEVEEIDKINKIFNSDIKKHKAIILDNFVGLVKLQNEATLLKCFTQGRHKNISVIVLSQYIYTVPPCIRTNCSHILIFKSNMRDLELIYPYQDTFRSKDEFLTFMGENTNDYYPVLIKNYVHIGDNSESVIKLQE